MGVFGTGIFADDDALDVRSDYRHFLADAQSDELASDAIAQQYGASLDDLAATTAFWLALAVTQWKMGRLDPRVKAAALRIMDEDLDLKKWGLPLRSKRAKVLAQARKKIESPQPQPARLPKPFPIQLPGWEFGEVVGVRLPSNRIALLHMIAYQRSSNYQVRAPVVSVLNWTGTDIPTVEELKVLTYINWRGALCGNHLYSLASPKGSPLQAGRFIHLGLFKPVIRAEARAAFCSIGKNESLDDLLEDVLTPYWEDPSLPPHHPGFGKAGAHLFKRQS